MKDTEAIAAFDLQYNNISSGAAPNLNLFEQSFFMTKAQDELVQYYYTGSNPRFDSFEINEETRRMLDTLIRSEDIELSNPLSFGKNWKEYVVKKDEGNRKVLYVLRESAVSGEAGCMDGMPLDVNPIKHEDLNRVLNNPFKGPTRYKAVRYDNAGKDVNFHIISAVPLRAYHLVWLQRPYPIILTPLVDDDGIAVFGDEYSTIHGENQPFSQDSVNEIPDVLMRKVISRACELAKASYLGDLSTSFAVNARDL